MWSRPLACCTLALSGCAGADPGSDSDGSLPDCGDESPAVEVGTGEDTFLPLSDGDELVLVHGPQGGWHLTIAARVAGVGSAAKFHPSASTVDGLAFAGGQVPENRELAPYDPASCSGDAPNLRVFLDSTDPVAACALAGHAVDIVLEVTDLATGASASGSARVTVRRDPVDEDLCP